MVATKQLKLAMETDEEIRARLEHLSDNQHLRLAAETISEKAKKKGMDLIVLRQKQIFFKERDRSPCNGNHFLVIIEVLSQTKTGLKYLLRAITRILFVQCSTQWYRIVDFWCEVKLRVSRDRGIKGKVTALTFDPLRLLSDFKKSPLWLI